MIHRPHPSADNREADRASRIAARNDAFRTGFTDDRLIVSLYLNEMGPAFIQRALDATRGFASFPAGDDRFGEHDFGAFRLDGQRLFWKIDTFANANCLAEAEDPLDPAACRALTIMFAEEW